MRDWSELREDLRRLGRVHPDVFREWPDPREEHPGVHRFEVVLDAWAEGIAADLHARYGDLVDLVVGALSFPDRTLERRVPPLPGTPAASDGLVVQRVGPSSVRSGRHAEVLATITNHSVRQWVLETTGSLEASFVDRDGRVVGGYTGAHLAKLVTFEIGPGKTREVPTLVGTDSVDPSLGYAVPPGDWQLVVELPTEAGPLASVPLPFTVVP